VGKLLVDGKVELKVRKTGERSEVEISDAVDAALNV
jgi:hypothetical protein